MKYVLVTGANGQLARTIKFLYSDNNDSIFFLFCSKKTLDVSRKDQLTRYFDNHKITHCINCAAYTDVNGAEKNEELAYKINALGAKNLSEVCFKQGTILTHISTDYVFDGQALTPYKTDDPTNPLNTYGKTKLEGENFVRTNLKNYYIIRTSWLYSHYENNFLNYVLDKVDKREQLQITTENCGVPTSCSMLARFLYFILKTNEIPYGTYHFSALGQTSWYGFAKEIINQTNKANTKLVKGIDSYVSSAKRPRYSVLDVSKSLQHFPEIKKWQDDLSQTITLRLSLL